MPKLEKESLRPKRSIKKIALIIGFIILNVIVIIATATSEFGNSKEAAELSEVKINWWLILPALGCFILATLANVYKYVATMRSAYKDKAPACKKIWRDSWRVVMLGKYYDNITPAAVGGQPFQVYYMLKNTDLPHGDSASIPLIGMISTQIGFLVIAIPCFIFGGLASENPTLLLMASVGLLFYAFWPIMVAGTTYFPKATAKFLNFFVKFLALIKVVKNREKALLKVEKEVSSYSEAVKEASRHGKLLIKLLLLSLIFEFLILSIPYFVLTAFGGEVGFVECFITTAAVTSAVYFVPTPGNSGAAEGTFFVVFSALSTGYIFWAMLFWRFFSYYIYIIIGALIYLRLYVKRRKTNN
ncbi:MAG: lysylphosphatidylglycerol synthase transmembrane domain-containing protein [Candidatus Saccharibacteria bacterium]|nr:lysylphosphatidylglycerol synthase transmembrane domain-containing protein [Candidatus Saccharibacteria bacterium]